MNFLTEELPDSITVDNIHYSIDTDFKTWIKIYYELNKGTKKGIINALVLAMGDIQVKFDLGKALEAICGFMQCGEEVSGTAKGKKCLDFAYDSKYIYAAFMQQYKIDLTETNMHWWKFRALFDGLDSNTKIMKIIEIRSVNLSEIKNKEQKAYYAKMQKQYRLPLSGFDKAINDELTKALKEGRDLSGILGIGGEQHE